MHSFIFSIAYLILPFLILLIFLLNKKEVYQNKLFTICIILLFLLSLVFIYSRFIETRLIKIQNTKINTGFKSKLIVISDIHLGVYKNSKFLEKVVDKINKIKNADAVIIPGDFIYYHKKDLKTLFEPLKNIKIPVFAILGNHDSEKPGPPIQKELELALKSHGVNFLQNKSYKLKDLTILGLGDKWTDSDEIQEIDSFSKHDNLIVFTHNPDTVLEYTNDIPDLTISGHTHGGQVRLPFIYKYAIPCIGDFDQGLYNGDYGKLFVSSGIGEVGLPMRLGIPPVIDILELY